MVMKPESVSLGDSHVAVILSTLRGGGAEKVATDVANYWTSRGRRVSIITIDVITEDRYPLDQRVQRLGLGLLRDSRSLAAALWNNRLRVHRLRRAIRDSTARQVVSFTDITNVTTLLACRGLNVEVIVCERTDPRRHRLGRIWSSLRGRTYGRARAIVVQTRSVAAWAAAQGWGRPIYVIPNAAPSLSEDQDREIRNPATQLVAVALGRLSPEKGFDLLIESFAEIAAAHPQWQLRIYGEGSERANLSKLAQERGVSDKVWFGGWTSNAEQALRSSDLFILPSRYEGFPNALLEAMAVGLPCISFDCDSGPREIIRHEIDGLLVPAGDVRQLAHALERLMSDGNLRKRLGEKAREVRQRFSRNLFYRRWDAVLEGMSLEEFDALSDPATS